MDIAIEAGVSASGQSVETLSIAASGNPFKEEVTLAAIEAAARSGHEQKIRALGQAWAAGVQTDEDARIFQETQFVRTIAILELPHIRVLERIVIRTAENPAVEGQSRTENTPALLSADLPEYGVTVVQLYQVSVSEGLIELVPQDGMVFKPQVVYVITAPGRDVLERLQMAAS